MRTLFIHPTDQSTTFGELVYNPYRGMDDVTILTGRNISSRVIKEALMNNDRIVFIGHGTEYGLLDMVGNARYVITSRQLQFFRDKEVICFWCNANIFADRYNLNAFSTGMFVSELSEARYYQLPEDQELIDASNTLFCNILSRCIFDNVNVIRENIEREYVDRNNQIICFNRQCMGFDEELGV